MVVRVELQKDFAGDPEVGRQRFSDFQGGVTQQQRVCVRESAVFGEGETHAFIRGLAEPFQGFRWGVCAPRESAADFQRIAQSKPLHDIRRNWRAVRKLKENFLLVAGGQGTRGLVERGDWLFHFVGYRPPKPLGKAESDGRIRVVGKALPSRLGCFLIKKACA